MKTFLAVAFAAVLTASGHAQSAAQPTSGTNTNTAATSSANDGFTKQGPRVIFTQAGQMTPLEKTLTLPNGTRIDPDGTVTMPDRSQTKLQPGQLVTLKGTIVPSGLPAAAVTSDDHTQILK